jgi:hypothetical protein
MPLLVRALVVDIVYIYTLVVSILDLGKLVKSLAQGGMFKDMSCKYVQMSHTFLLWGCYTSVCLLNACFCWLEFLNGWYCFTVIPTSRLLNIVWIPSLCMFFSFIFTCLRMCWWSKSCFGYHHPIKIEQREKHWKTTTCFLLGFYYSRRIIIQAILGVGYRISLLIPNTQKFRVESQSWILIASNLQYNITILLESQC